MKNSSDLDISCKVVFSLNKWNKKVGHQVRSGENAKHAINDAQKGCTMQLNGITSSQRGGTKLGSLGVHVFDQRF